MSKEVTSPTIPKCRNGRPEKIPHPSKALAGKGLYKSLFVLQNLLNFVSIQQPRMRKWEGENGMLHQDLVPLHVKTLVLLSKINNTPIAMADLLQAMGCYDGEILTLSLFWGVFFSCSNPSFEVSITFWDDEIWCAHHLTQVCKNFILISCS